MNKTLRIIILTIILIMGVLLINQSNYQNNKLYAVNLKDSIDKDLVSILVGDGSENYTTYEESTFPSNTEYAYNSELSKCQDKNGKVLEGILSYDETTGKVNVKTKKTAYCYLYFDKLSSSFADELIASGSLWQSGLEGDGYRYTGSGNATASTSPNNFICFGTTSLSECKADESKYMYRIIGIFPDESGIQHLKLIKYKQLGAYKWHLTNSDVSWEDSDLYKGLNGLSGGSYSNLFIGNTTYDYLQDTKWLNKIADWKWTATKGYNYNSITTEQMYLYEMNRSTKTNTNGEWTYPVTKIGLMYASDYQMSLGSSALTMASDYNYTTLKTGWLHQVWNDTTANTWEWLMSRPGSHLDIFRAWRVGNDGREYFGNVDSENGVRPVFYLDSKASVSDGTGSYDDPYLIQE